LPQFIRNQDALFRTEHASTSSSTSGGFEEAQKSYEAQIAALKDDLSRAKTNATALEKRNMLEQQLMLSAWHELGSRTVREHVAQAGTRRSQPKPQPVGWLGRQRRVQEEAGFVSGSSLVLGLTYARS
jgi:protein HOOK3